MSTHPQKPMTTASGHPISDDQNSITAGPDGPVLIQDFHLLETLQHFDRERIPERVVHAKGSGAYGTFTVTHDITKYTKAKLFETVGKETEVFVRFSLVAPERGGAETDRDTRGFAVRFYTEEGNWDLVGNNVPIFFIKDALKFPEMVHTHKRDPQTNLKSPTAFWDFNSHAPETLHNVTMRFSTRGIPDGYRHMDGFGTHTFSLISEGGERNWVKYHLKTQQGNKTLSSAQAEGLGAQDPDYAHRDLLCSIDSGEFPKWDVFIQVMGEECRLDWEQRTGWSAFDATKVWPHKDAPLIPLGVLELNRNVANFHAEVEQAAFNPANIVPGLGFSPDKLLQGRILSYHDTQLYRLGANHQQLEVNRPRCPVSNNQRDGFMTIVNTGPAPNYTPVKVIPGMKALGLDNGEPALQLSGAAGRYDTRGRDDDYTQAGDLFRLMAAGEKRALFENLADSLGKVSNKEIQERQLAQFDKADPEYGKGVRVACTRRAGQQA